MRWATEWESLMCWPVLTPWYLCKFSSRSEEHVDRSPQKADAVFQDFPGGERAYCLILYVIDLNPVTQGVTTGHKNISDSGSNCFPFF